MGRKGTGAGKGMVGEAREGTEGTGEEGRGGENWGGVMFSHFTWGLDATAPRKSSLPAYIHHTGLFITRLLLQVSHVSDETPDISSLIFMLAAVTAASYFLINYQPFAR